MVIPREPFGKSYGNSCEINRMGLRRDYTPAPQINEFAPCGVTKPYLLGVLHDATVRKTTYRIATKNLIFARILKRGIMKFGVSAWIYKEGKYRNLWIVEFSKSLLLKARISTKKDKVDFIRGFFDAEGGISKGSNVRFYLYFCQKDKNILLTIKRYLQKLGIESGVIHNPSKKVDPNYWRFYIKANSYKNFAKIIRSNHPDKLGILRKKI